MKFLQTKCKAEGHKTEAIVRADPKSNGKTLHAEQMAFGNDVVSACFERSPSNQQSLEEILSKNQKMKKAVKTYPEVVKFYSDLYWME